MFTNADFIAYPEILPPLDQVVLDENLRQRVLQLIQEACSLLLRLEGQKVCEIDAAVTDGHVILRGNVECRSLQRLAESVTRTIPEVKSVTSEIRVIAEPLGVPLNTLQAQTIAV
jgi:hypothetical protein